MAKEIERKFLFYPERIENLGAGQTITQAYIATQDEMVVRVRINNGNAFLTLKGKTLGATRSEFEYAIPLEDARAIIAELCTGPVISKTRYEIHYAEHLWELDVFHDDNEGLYIAEVELNSEDEVIELPSWLGEEVTGDTRYYNNNLLTQPFSQWCDKV